MSQLTLAALPESALTMPDGSPMPDSRVGLLLNDIRNTAAGGIASASNEVVRKAAVHYSSLQQTGGWLLTVVVLALAVLGAGWAWKRVSPDLRARNGVELAVKTFMVICSTIAIFTTIGIIMSLLFESLRFFSKVPVTDFLFGTHWSPQISLRTDQVGSSAASGPFRCSPALS